jgi:hypothetical protein
MTNTKKLFLSLTFGCVFAYLMGMVIPAHATNAARGAKEVASVIYTTQMTTATQSVPANTFAPAVVYQIVVGTATTAGIDYIVLYDTNACQGYTTGGVQQVNMRIPRVAASTSTVDLKFDPPIQFFNGLCIQPSGVGIAASVTFEPGRGAGQQ